MKQFRSMAYPYVAWISVLIVVPMLLIIAYAFTVEGTAFFQGQFTLANFARFFSDAVFIQVLLRSLRVAILTTIVCLLLGYPAAYAIARAGKRSTFLILVITLPTWINMLVRTYAWVGILQDDGLLNHLLGLFGIGPLQMMYTDFAVVLGMVYNFLPFMVLPIYNV
ncbi:MAG: ABC transporter permease, partial [Butyricicoccus porcorum]